MATGLLSRMTYDCCGDRAEARHRLENDFVNMQIKHNEFALAFCVQVRKKHGDILRYKSISQRKLVRQVLTGISRHHRSYGMTVILLLKQPHLSMQEVEQDFMEFDRFRPTKASALNVAVT